MPQGIENMSSVAAAFLRPTFLPTRLLMLKPPPLTSHKIFLPTSLPRLLDNRKNNLPRQTSMAAQPPTGIRPGHGPAGDGGSIRALEREAFIDGPSSPAATGLEATVNNLSKWVIAVIFGVFVLVRHDATALWAAWGSIINAAMSNMVKGLLNQERPVPNLRSDPGMPSSHAQSISYATAFFILSVIDFWGLNGITAAISGIFLAIGSYFIWLRVSQQLHTISQVAVGAVLGSIFLALWFWVWNSFVLKAYASNLWIRIAVILGGAAFCTGFVLYVIRYWIVESVSSYMSRKLQS